MATLAEPSLCTGSAAKRCADIDAAYVGRIALLVQLLLRTEISRCVAASICSLLAFVCLAMALSVVLQRARTRVFREAISLLISPPGATQTRFYSLCGSEGPRRERP